MSQAHAHARTHAYMQCTHTRTHSSALCSPIQTLSHREPQDLIILPNTHIQRYAHTRTDAHTCSVPSGRWMRPDTTQMGNKGGKCENKDREAFLFFFLDYLFLFSKIRENKSVQCAHNPTFRALLFFFLLSSSLWDPLYNLVPPLSQFVFAWQTFISILGSCAYLLC